jgi:hypothetical protein
MDTINRSALVVVPAAPFLDWLRRVDPTSADLSLDDLRREATVYLVPEYDTVEEAQEHLRKCCGEIFEEELDGWYRVPSAWPVDRSFDTFVHWFEYAFHSVIFDVCAGPLNHDQ